MLCQRPAIHPSFPKTRSHASPHSKSDIVPKQPCNSFFGAQEFSSLGPLTSGTLVVSLHPPASQWLHLPICARGPRPGQPTGGKLSGGKRGRLLVLGSSAGCSCLFKQPRKTRRSFHTGAGFPTLIGIRWANGLLVHPWGSRTRPGPVHNLFWTKVPARRKTKPLV